MKNPTEQREDTAIEADVLPIGTRIRHRSHPELTGRISHYEWQSLGELSALPYNIVWDHNSRAYDVLGWLWIYGSNDSVEAAE